MSKELWMVCMDDPRWAASEIERLKKELAEIRPETGKRTGKCGAWAEGLIERKYCDLEFGHPGPHSYQRAPAEAASAGDTPRPARPVMSEGNLSGWSVYVTSLERYTDQLERELSETHAAWDETSAALNAEVDRREKAESALSAKPLISPGAINDSSVSTIGHWVFDAAEKHRPIVEGLVGCDLDRKHLLYMLDRIKARSFSPTKACRWLGWIQGILNEKHALTLDEAKAINKAASDAFATASATQERKA